MIVEIPDHEKAEQSIVSREGGKQIVLNEEQNENTFS
jgi:hypothetical protein